MKVLLFGATGTAGSGILQACLQAPDVAEVRALARRPLGAAHDKLKVFLHDDYLDFVMAAAAELRSGSPDAVLHFVSGEGTSLDSRFMWARVKAETERDLAGVIATVCWRPAFIDGGSAVSGPRLYRALRPLFRLLRFARALYVTSEDIGRAMLCATAEGTRRGVIVNAQIRALAERAREGACTHTKAR